MAETGTKAFDCPFNFSELTQLALSSWNLVPHPKNFPPRSGLYVIYSEVDETCLYIGRSQNLLKRGQCHSMWEKAVLNYESPHVAYKIIECDNPNEIKRELIYGECLLIGLLRPKWNAFKPASSSDILPDNFAVEKLQLVHWTQLFADKYREPFHRLMLTSDGYVVPKMANAIMETGKVKKEWVRVLYDKRYVQEWLNVSSHGLKPSQIITLLREAQDFYEEYLKCLD